MAQHFSDRLASVTWQLMLQSLYLMRRNADSIPEGYRRVQLISPWISDIEHRGYQLPFPLREALGQEVGRDLGHLGELLKQIASTEGCTVQLLTHPLDGGWKGNWSPESKRRELEMLDRFSRSGIDVRVHPTNHSKSILTPLGVLVGSANITQNGFYQNEERLTLTSANEPEFPGAAQVGDGFWRQGRPWR